MIPAAHKSHAMIAARRIRSRAQAAAMTVETGIREKQIIRCRVNEIWILSGGFLA